MADEYCVTLAKRGRVKDWRTVAGKLPGRSNKGNNLLA